MGGICGKDNIKKSKANEKKKPDRQDRPNGSVTPVMSNPPQQVENIIPEVNISINDEFTNRRDNIIHCNRCNDNFPNQRDFNQHFNYCGVIRTNHGVHHSLTEILHLLNRHLQNDNTLALMALLSHEEPEDCLDYIDWEYTRNMWKNVGKVHLTSIYYHNIESDIQFISNLKLVEVKKERYWRKRLWFLSHINNKIYDKKESNTTLVVSRDNILEESFNQFMTTHELDLRKAMQIFFIDEIAQDIGGVYREWYSVLFDSIFNNKFFYPVNNAYSKYSCYINVDTPLQENYSLYYEFFGKIIAKALFDKITIKMNLNPVLIKQILDIEIVLEDIKYLDINVYTIKISIIIL
jgi:hypothetical protein